MVPGDELCCYGGKFLTNQERAALSPEELKTCLQLNLWKGHDESDGSALFIQAPIDPESFPLGAKINSAMYGFEEWCTGKNSQEVEAEYKRRMSMVNCRFTEHHDSRPLTNKHYVTITATRAFTGNEEMPHELVLGYEQGTDDAEIEDTLSRVLARIEEDDDGEEDDDDGEDWSETVEFFCFFFRWSSCW